MDKGTDCLAFPDAPFGRTPVTAAACRAHLAKEAQGGASMRNLILASHSTSRHAVKSEVLTRRERDVLRKICDGLTNKRIAQVLGISPETVKTHVTHIIVKLGVANRAHAVSYAKSLGLL
jgi:DNA-binding NarL/FixJ family response regulator